MDPVQALAILSLGAFVMVLVTAMFYMFTVRPRLLDDASASMVRPGLWRDLDTQRSSLDDLNATLARHTLLLEAQARTVGPETDGDTLQAVLREQTTTANKLTELLAAQSSQIAGLDTRLQHQEDLLTRTAQQIDTLAQTVQAQPARAGAPIGAGAEWQALIQSQADKLVAISTQLDAWGAQRAAQDDQMANHARVLAELDRELVAHAQAVQRIETKVDEHTRMLVTAQNERQSQISLLEHVMDRLAQAIPLLNKLLTSPPRPDQDRLTDIKGIGPVYAGKLYEAGVQTFRQLAAMTPPEIYALINEPAWRMRSIDAESWIEQGKHLASQREKVEHIT